MRIAMAAAVAGITMGGWAVVTVKDVPEYFVAGQRYTIEFQVRQHGRRLLSDLHSQLLVSTSRTGDEQRITANPGATEGAYTAAFTAPRSGQLYLTIMSGWGASNLRLYPVPIVASGVTPSPIAQVERGRDLFIAKGCNSCHTNSDLTDRPDNQQVAIGPELGGRHLARAYVIQKIKNPASQAMPDLGLSDAEATAIATFLTAERTTATGR